MIDAWAAFCCRCSETMPCLVRRPFVCVVEMGNVLIDALEIVSDHSRASVFGVVVECVNGQMMASGEHDEAVET